MDNKYLLEIKDMSKSFPGVQALDGAQFKLRPGTVHALIGENGAGKSTLMKCLFGIYKRDSGTILYQGEQVEFQNTKQALESGIAMVQQELNQVLDRSVTENIWLGRFLKKGIVVDINEMNKHTKEVFESLSVDIDPQQKLSTLSVSQRQLVEVARAISLNAKVIVLDEATSSLADQEVEKLFEIIETLKARGCGIVYISHKLAEIMEISDDVTVMRDGKWIMTDESKNCSIDILISKMVGRSLTSRFPEKDNAPSKEVLLRVEKLNGTYSPAIKDASFTLHKGEILGVGGLMGSRRTELVETIFGLRHLASGAIYMGDGNQIVNKNPRQAIANGFALLTEERRSTGIFKDLSLLFNSTISSLKKNFNKFGILSDKSIAKNTQWVIDSLRVKAPSAKAHIGDLSGGNQQKVILGRWLLADSKVLLLDEPTRGVDVGAKYEIYQLIIDEAKKGKGVLFISSELPELLGVSDRIMVLSNGKVAGIVNTSETNQQELMHLAVKYN